MIDVYYELEQGAKVFGQQHRYIAQFNYHPEESPAVEKRFHAEAMMHSRRVWMENANGVTIIKNGRDLYRRHEAVDYKELTWIKLQAIDLLT
jgi:hypothetical protein